MTRRIVLLALLFLGFAAVAGAMEGPGASVSGWIYQAGSETGAPGSGTAIPGLRVSLVHPQLGRSHPDISDERGHFELTAIPPMSTPYFLEIYWGKTLVYRRQLRVQGDVELGGVGI